MVKPLSLLLIGSASTHTFRYLAGIAPHVGTVHLICSSTLPERYQVPNLGQVLTVDFSLTALTTAGKIAAFIEQHAPDIVHVHQANSVAHHARRALAGKGVPWVLTVWGSDVLLLPQQNPWFKRMVSANLAAASAITSDSLYMAAVCRELADIRRMAVLNFGVDALPAMPDIAAKPLNVLSCRLHKPLYRIEAILHAWAQIEADPHFAAWTLSIAANGEQTPALQQLAAQLKLKRAQFSGFVSPEVLAQHYQQARVFVSVPRSDATSISLLEAMSHGCLPLLSNLPANGEWVIDGLNGVIVEDVQRLAQALAHSMTQAASDEHLQQIAQINRQLVADKGLHQQNMQQFATLYQDLLATS